MLSYKTLNYFMNIKSLLKVAAVWMHLLAPNGANAETSQSINIDRILRLDTEIMQEVFRSKEPKPGFWMNIDKLTGRELLKEITCRRELINIATQSQLFGNFISSQEASKIHCQSMVESFRRQNLILSLAYIAPEVDTFFSLLVKESKDRDLLLNTKHIEAAVNLFRIRILAQGNVNIQTLVSAFNAKHDMSESPLNFVNYLALAVSKVQSIENSQLTPANKAKQFDKLIKIVQDLDIKRDPRFASKFLTSKY